MKKYLPALILSSLAILGANFAHAATYTITCNGAPAYDCFNDTIPSTSGPDIPIGDYNFSFPPFTAGDVPSNLNDFYLAPARWAITPAGGSNFILHITNTWTRGYGGYFEANSPYQPCSGYNCTFSLTTAAPPEAISFNTPTYGYNGPDFRYFYINGSNLSTTTLYRFDVVYSLAGGSETYDDFNLSTAADPSALLRIVKSHSLPDGTGWTAQGFLFATSSTDLILAVTDPGAAIASTTPISFSINASTTVPGAGEVVFGGGSATNTVSLCGSSTPFFVGTSSLPYFILNPPDPIIKYAICSAFAGLFQMTDDQQARVSANYNHAQNIIGKKAPFGYFAIGIAALNSFDDGSSTPLISDDGMTALYPIFNPLDAGLAEAIGALSLFWLLRRIKHIQP